LKNLSKGVETNIGGNITHTVKQADELVLLTKRETVLHAKTERLSEIGRCREWK
jgi:hypothetical protein